MCVCVPYVWRLKEKFVEMELYVRQDRLMDVVLRGLTQPSPQGKAAEQFMRRYLLYLRQVHSVLTYILLEHRAEEAFRRTALHDTTTIISQPPKHRTRLLCSAQRKLSRLPTVTRAPGGRNREQPCVASPFRLPPPIAHLPSCQAPSTRLCSALLCPHRSSIRIGHPRPLETSQVP